MLDADNINLVTGGRGSLSWEQAAERFARRAGLKIADCLTIIEAAGHTLVTSCPGYLTALLHQERQHDGVG
jgi:hypothetical protein